MQGQGTDKAHDEERQHGGLSSIDFRKREYKKEATLRVDTGFDRVKASDIINAIEDDFGDDSVFACVPRGGCYEVTLCDEETAKVVAGGISIKGKSYNCRIVTDRSLVVSFLHLTPYIEDSQIIDMLHAFGVEVISNIKRHFIKDAKRKITDGTRYVRVKFPEQLKSLPYSVRFNTCDGPQPFRVIHNGQVKTCNLCFETDHVMAECPSVECRVCHGQGHIARSCPQKQRCDECKNKMSHCMCYNDRKDKPVTELSTDTSVSVEEIVNDDVTVDPFSVNMETIDGEEANHENDWSLSAPTEANKNTDKMPVATSVTEHIIADDNVQEGMNVESENERRVDKSEIADERKGENEVSSEKLEDNSNVKHGTKFRKIQGMNEERVVNLSEERKRKKAANGENGMSMKQMRKAKARAKAEARAKVEARNDSVNESECELT